MGRRQFMEISGLVAAAVLLPGPERSDLSPTPAPAEDDTRLGSPVPVSPEVRESVMAEAEPGISPRDLATASLNVGVFAHSVMQNARGREPFGLKSIGRGMAAFVVRLVVLATGGARDREVANGELIGLAKSLAIGSALVGAAEVASHLEFDSGRLLDRVRTLGEGIDAEMQRAPSPSPEDGMEAWNGFLVAQQRRVIRTQALSLATTAEVTPVGSIFAGAAAANVTNQQLAAAMADFRYAQTVIAAKRDLARAELASQASDAAERFRALLRDEGALRARANTVAERDMNGLGGGVPESWVRAANIQAVYSPFVVGGAPNPFYLARNGAKEWAIASGYGFVLMNTLAFGAVQTWLATKLGLTEAAVYKQFAPAVLYFVPQVGKGLAEFVTKRDASLHDGRNWAEEVDGALRTVAADPSALLDAEAMDILADLLRSRPRLSVELNTGGLAQSLSEARADMQAGMIRGHSKVHDYIVRMAYVFGGVDLPRGPRSVGAYLGKLASGFRQKGAQDGDSVSLEESITLDGLELQDMIELVQQHPDIAALPRALVERYGSAANAQRINQLLDVMLAIVGRTDLTDEQRILLQTSFADPELAASIDRLTTQAEAALQGDDLSGLAATFDQLKALPIISKQTREVLERLELTLNQALTADPHAGTSRGLSHATKDVVRALFTQLSATGSLSACTLKIIEWFGDSLPPMARNALILSLGVVITTFADNIVAYQSKFFIFLGYFG